MSGSLSSQLTLQSLLASAGGAPQDPAIMAALPRMQLAQALSQEGTSTAPASKWQGIGRLAQALLGGYLQNESTSGIQDILKQRAKDAADVTNTLQSPMRYQTTPSGPDTMPGQQPSTQTFATRIGGAEAPNPGTVNSSGYSGQYQFGAERLADPAVGVYHPAQGENLRENQWKGTFNVPGFPDVKTHADFLANPAAQKAAFDLHLADIDKNIAGMPNAAGQDPNGLRAVAHLGGVEGMKRFVSSGGLYDPADANGTHLSDYYKRFSGGGGNGVTPSAGPVASPSPGIAPQAPNPWDIIHRANQIISDPHYAYNPQALTAAHAAIDEAKLRLSIGSYSIGKNGVQENAYSGEQKSAATPALDYRQTAPGIYTSPGADPKFAPSPRMAMDSHGNLLAAGPGSQVTTVAENKSGITGNTPESNAARILAELGAKAAGGQPLTPQEQANFNVAVTMFQQPKPIATGPDQTVTMVPGRPLPAGIPNPVSIPPPTPRTAPAPMSHGMAPPVTGASEPPGSSGSTKLVGPDTSAIAAQASARAQGTETGKNAATTLPKMIELGHEADTALGNIDYGMNQLHQAAAGGIKSGYFAPWLATAAAAGKSLGVDLNSLGINPQAVGNVQSAQKTLGVVAGTILQNTIGKGSAITDAKIDHFIHTQPGIETDPQAIERVLGWARSQFAYNRDMAMHAMGNTDPQTGMIPPGWQAQFYKDKGAFAPIYDPLSQEMKQPQGEGPATAMPKAEGAQPPIPGARLAPDNKWYLPDPARPGKYLQVK